MIVCKRGLQAVDAVRFPLTGQIQHTAHTGKFLIVRAADRFFKELLLPVRVRRRKRTVQLGAACRRSPGELRRIPIHTVDLRRLIGENVGEALVERIGVQPRAIVFALQCSVDLRISVPDQQMRDLMRQQVANDCVEVFERRMIALLNKVKNQMDLPVGRTCGDGVIRCRKADDQIERRLKCLPVWKKRIPNRAVDGDKVRSRFTDTAFELAHSLSESKILRRRSKCIPAKI